ncbi:MAG: hypothetical protein ACE5GQ_06935 [Nitrospinales bacterium]
MTSEAYNQFFRMHYERVRGDYKQLILFAVRFYQLVIFPESDLEKLPTCPDQKA